jgi:hypothetical protein
MVRQGKRKREEGEGDRERRERLEGERGEREGETGRRTREARDAAFLWPKSRHRPAPQPHPQWRLAATFAVAESPLRLRHAVAN